MTSLAKRVDLYLLIVLALPIAYVSGLLYFFEPTDTGTGEDFVQGTLINKVKWLVVLGMAAGALFLYRSQTFRLFRFSNIGIILFLSWACVSILWSDYPVTTIKKILQFGGLVFAVICFHIYFQPANRLPLLMRNLFTVSMVLSFIIVVVNPSVGIDYELGGAWRGILGQKNTLGQVASLCCIMWLYTLMTKQAKLQVAIPFFLFALMMLIMSLSKTSLATTLIASSIYLLFRRRWIAGESTVFRAAGVLLIGFMIYAHLYSVIVGEPTWGGLMSPLTALLGKDATLTGRTDIWELVMLHVGQHSLLGVGYQAYWLGPGSPSQFVLDNLTWIIYQSHNGYVDIWNETGLIGLGLTIFFIIVTLVKLYQFSKFNREVYALYVGLFVMILISNFSETSLFRGTGLYQVVAVYIAMEVPLQLMRYRQMMTMRQQEILRQHHMAAEQTA